VCGGRVDPGRSPGNCARGLSSGRGFAPRFWGANMWRVLHAVAWGYRAPDEVVGDDPAGARRPAVLAFLGPDPLLRREACERFYRSLVHVLPCGSCCKNYARVIEGKSVKGDHDDRPVRPSPSCVLRPSVFDSRARLTAWLHSVHNCNRRTHGKARDVVLKDARRMYAGTDASAHIWGRPLWNSLLFVAWSFPTDPSSNPERAAAFQDFFSSLAAVLPLYASPGAHASARELAVWVAGGGLSNRAALAHAVTTLLWRHALPRGRRAGFRDFAEFNRTVCSKMASLRGE